MTWLVRCGNIKGHISEFTASFSSISMRCNSSCDLVLALESAFLSLVHEKWHSVSKDVRHHEVAYLKHAARTARPLLRRCICEMLQHRVVRVWVASDLPENTRRFLRKLYNMSSLKFLSTRCFDMRGLYAVGMKLGCPGAH